MRKSLFRLSRLSLKSAKYLQQVARLFMKCQETRLSTHLCEKQGGLGHDQALHLPSWHTPAIDPSPTRGYRMTHTDVHPAMVVYAMYPSYGVSMGTYADSMRYHRTFNNLSALLSD
jgi:hypothetical protein